MNNKLTIPILYEDKDVIAFNKPTGLLVIPTSKGETKTLVNVVNAQYLSLNQNNKLHPCHRLDRETSGVILFAKSKRIQAQFMDLFKKRQILKCYIAFVYGKFTMRNKTIKGNIVHLDKRKFRKSPQAKLAVTKVKRQVVKRHYSVLEVRPITGRTNQIRIQLRNIGHPILGDRKYTVVKNYPIKFKRTALHASSLEFRHPFSKKYVKIFAVLPQDMKILLQSK